MACTVTHASRFRDDRFKLAKAERELREHVPSPTFTTPQFGFDITNAHSLLFGANTCNPGDPVNSSVKEPRSV
jgi:hypothetical protein